MASGECRKCHAPIGQLYPAHGGRPRVFCETCSPPGRRDRWKRPEPPSPHLVVLPQDDAPAAPVELSSRRRKADAAEPPARRAPEPPDDEPRAAAATGARAVLDATQKALDEAQATETAEGALALHLAGLIAAGGYTASGAAALSKALRDAMAEALKARPTNDALDELVRRRRDRLRGAV